LEYYKAYIEELENTLEELIEHLKEKSEKNLLFENLQTENMELKRKLNKFTKVISLSTTDIDMDFCDEEICTANKLMLIDMKNNYNKLLKIRNNNRLDNILFN
jgi:hypothetical protein